MHDSKFAVLLFVGILLFVGALACGGSSEVTQPPESAETKPAEVLPTDVPPMDIPPTDIPPTEIPAEPTPSVPELEVLSHQSYVDRDWLHIVGEVRNNTASPMEYVKIVATLYDAEESVVGMDFTYTMLDTIPAGGTSPFETGTDEWAGTASYKLQVEGRTGDLPRQDLVIRSHESYVDGDWLHVRGEVENTGTRDAEYVKVVITLYDAAGNVVGMDFTYMTLDTIPAGGTSPFESGTDYWPGFDHYQIQVEGR